MTEIKNRVTVEDIESAIVGEHYFTARDGFEGALAAGTYSGREKPADGGGDPSPLDVLTFCVLVLRNGYTVVGKSACVDPANFDAEIGRRVARENAVNEMWPLMGYALKDKLHEQHAGA